MPSGPKVFVSHSAKEPEAQRLCEAIVQHLQGSGFEPLWDQHLQTAQEWRAVIDEWIWRCDAAILVLSPAATESRYVAYEAALLRQRWKHSAGQFVLIPIWCPGVSETVLKDRMDAPQMSEIHTGIKLSTWSSEKNGGVSPVDSAGQQVVARLLPLLTSLQARHDVEDLLIKQLYFGTQAEDALREIAVQYSLPPVLPVAKKDLAAALARHLLDFGVPIGPQRFRALAAGIDTMMTAMSDARDRVPRIINLIAPFCWVSPTGAVRVAALPTLPDGKERGIAWRRSWLLSERMYVYRGYCTRSRTKLKIADVSDGAGGGTDSILEHIRSTLAREVCHAQEATNDQLAARIKHLTQEGVPVFLLVPARAVDAAILDEVWARWPEVCVFLFGDTLDEAQIREQFPKIAFVDPPLREEDEAAARVEWGECMDAAGITYEDLDSGAAFLA